MPKLELNYKELQPCDVLIAGGGSAGVAAAVAAGRSGAKTILIETDCPFLTPIPHRGERNEPKYVKYVAEELAKIHNVSIEEIGEITSENTKKLFGVK